jgi:4-carboxymuconolactone decarboxylase
MNEDQEKKDYFREMEKERGYVLDFHRILGNEDFDFLKNYDQLLKSSYLNKESVVEEKTREMILIAVLIAAGSTDEHIKTHMALGKKIGITQKEMLEILKLVLLPIGLPGFMRGFDIWNEIFKVEAIDENYA